MPGGFAIAVQAPVKTRLLGAQGPAFSAHPHGQIVVIRFPLTTLAFISSGRSLVEHAKKLPQSFVKSLTFTLLLLFAARFFQLSLLALRDDIIQHFLAGSLPL